MAGPVIPPGVVKQAGRAGPEAGQLHRARGNGRRSRTRRDSPPARQMPADHDRQHGENHDHSQPPAPAGPAVPAMAQHVIHYPHRLKQPMPVPGRYVVMDDPAARLAVVRHAVPVDLDWQPLILEVLDDYARSLAAGAVLHGGAHLVNMLWHDGRLAALLDFESARIGPPDLAGAASLGRLAILADRPGGVRFA